MPDTPIAMPKLGMSMEEGRVIAWPVPLGSAVAKGDIVLVIESEKAEVEIEATGSGVLRHIYVEPDETVPCGSLLAALTESQDSPFDPEAFHADHHRPEPVGSAGTEPADAAAADTPAPTRASGSRGGPATPAARTLARKMAIELSSVTGTGPGGRITKEDVEAASQNDERVPVADGVKLEVPSAGSGQPVLFLPGFGSDASSFAPQTDALASEFTVRVVHPRGIGASSAPETESYDVSTSASDALALADTPVHLVGASLGAATAIEAALSAPDRVASLALITPFVTASHRLRAVLAAWSRIVDEASSDAAAGTLLPWLFSEAWLAETERRERTERGLAAMLRCTTGAVLGRYAAGIAAWSGTRAADLAKIEVPVLVVGAKEDLLTPDARRVADGLPKGRFVEVPAGHAACLEAAGDVCEALTAHLRALD